ncbi:sensor histidine kinase [Merismopedia glauca]|uniref:histidine kinase n=1 Tax=Merismopedia glauca CCAP 1448/3 TaxID=1296344 RepID=A0A2T1C8Y4_9CYAN|nr:HAMP domain-containing sensor histidine kinase [Merismopedia glauca]PSB04607.1 two-component sensor histidine kinase [Merismopedia glauca CCAP 1448/3]
MFQAIRYRLLFSYLSVLAAILGVFAIAVRITFAHSLDLQLVDRLKTLARSAALELELVDGNVEIDDETLVSSEQGIQWFNTKGNFLAQQGDYVLKLPFNPKIPIQTQSNPYPAKSMTILVKDRDTGIFIGYTRVSESTQNLNHTLQSLDLGLGIGVVTALALSGIGGIWLTRQAMEPIERSFQRLQQFTADASHELRNPLMAIKTNAAVALKYAEGIRESDGEKFRAIASATTQMTALTEDLLLLARTDHTPPPKLDRVNLSILLEELAQLYHAPAQIKQIDFQRQILEDMEVSGDAVQLTRLFTNLIDNAFRYTPDRGSIAILSSHQGKEILVSIQDTGIGIAPDRLEQIFDRFWRVNRDRTYGSGFGLGLAIAQNIAHNHSGAIALTSELGAGSCFTVRLPSAPKSHLPQL